MSRFGNQIRLPSERNARLRRNADDLSSNVSFIDPNEPIALNTLGKLVLTLLQAGGLVVTGGALGIKLNGTDLTITADGINISSRFRDEVRQSVEAQLGNPSLEAAMAVNEAIKVSLMNDA